MATTVALAAIPHANAQEAANPTAEPASDQETKGIEDIVVTAQRRSESLQRSSLSIQVLGTEALERAAPTRAEDLNVLVPGIQIASVGANTQISIRGISDNSSNPLGNPSVSFNVDGVYVGRSTSISTNFYDVARVEVLKGPQGTLYGRNASGGAVNLITQAPQLGADSGYLEVEAGNYALRRVLGGFNKALGDTMALRAAFQGIDRDGFLSDGTSDSKSMAGRVRLLWQPSDTVSLLLNADAANQRGFGEGWVITPRLDGADPWEGSNSAASVARVIAGTPPPLVAGIRATGTSRQRNSFYNLSAQLDLRLGFATLTVLPAYRRADEDYETWGGFLYGQKNQGDQYSVETRLGNDGKILKWVVGGYFYDDRQDVDARAVISDYASSTNLVYKPTTRSWAGFGEATLSLTPKLRAIGGIRYTDEKKTIAGRNYNTTIIVPAGTVAETISGEVKFTAVTWKGGAEFDIAPHSLLYANVSTGFKGGGLNPIQETASGRYTYRPEKITAYNLGLRNRFLDNRLQVNVEAFHYAYRDKQESTITLSDLGNVVFLTSNAGRASISGGSIEIVARATPNDTISLFGEYNHNKYDSFILTKPAFLFDPSTTACASSVSNGTATIDCSGRPLVKAPKWVGSAAYEHRFDLADGGEVTAAIDTQLSSMLWIAADYVLGERAPGYAVVNGALTYTSPDHAWSFTAYVKNLTEATVYKNGSELPFQGPLVAAVIGAPRTFGGRVRFSF